MWKQTEIVPKRRFKEFCSAGAWELGELGNISDVTKLAGFEFTKYVTYSDDGGKVIALRGLNVKDGKLVLDDVKYIDESDFSKLSRSKLFRDDILFTYVGTIGEVAVVPDNDRFYLAPNVARIRLNKFLFPSFIAQQMGSKSFYNRVIHPLIATSSQSALSMENIRKFVLRFPRFDEQEKISHFFSHVDNLITLHQRKLDKVKALKSAYLFEMFPAEGENMPKRRFEGFTDPWEQRTFSTLVTRVSKSSDEDVLPRVEYEDIVSGQGELNKDIYAEESNKKGIAFEVGDTLFGKLRPYLQNWLLADFKGVAVGDWWVLRPNEIDSKFIYSLVQSNKFQIVANLSTGTKMPRSDWNIVSQTEFKVPTDTDEQVMIGALFGKLDHLITLHQRKLEKLKNIKKAYLNEMFV